MNSVSTSRRPSARQWGLLVGCVAVATLLMTYPVWVSPSGVIAGIGDASLNTWIMAWNTHAALSGDADLLDTNIFYPASNTLAMSENLLGITPIAAPFAASGAPTVGYNVVFLVSMALVVLATALWVRYLTGSMGIGLFAGIAAGFAPSRMDHLPQIQLLAAFWVPVCLLMVSKYVDTRQGRYAVFSAVALGMQYLSGIQTTVLFALFVGLYGFVLLRSQGLREPVKVVLHGVLAGAVLLAIVVPVSLPYLDAADAGMSRTLVETSRYATQPVNFLSPSHVNRAPHMRWLRQFRDHEANHFSGVVVWGLVLAGFVVGWRRRPGVPWSPSATFVAASAALYCVAVAAAHFELSDGLVATLAAAHPATLLFVALLLHLLVARPGSMDRDWFLFSRFLGLAALAYLLSHGPYFHAADAELGAGPFRFLFELKPFQSVRAVGRFGMVASFFLASAAAVGLKRLLPSGPRARAAFAALFVVLVAELWAAPLPVAPPRPREQGVYEAVAALPGDGAILHIPVVPPPIPSETTEYLMGSTRHWRRLVNGYSGFGTSHVLRLSQMDPFSDRFFEYVDRETPVDYFVLHPGLFSSRVIAEETLARALASDRLRVATRGDGFVIFRRRAMPRGGLILQRRVAWADARNGYEVSVRRAAGQPLGAVFRWGSSRGTEVQLDRTWQLVALPPPSDDDREVDGSVVLTARAVRPVLRSRPLGTTGAELSAEVLVDAQRFHAGIAIDEYWLARARSPQAIIVATLTEDGHDLARWTRVPTDGPVEATIQGLLDEAGSRIVIIAATGIQRGNTEAITEALRAAADQLGGMGPGETAGNDRYVLMGVLGAPPGSAREHESSGRAALREGPQAARRQPLQLR